MFQNYSLAIVLWAYLPAELKDSPLVLTSLVQTKCLLIFAGRQFGDGHEVKNNRHSSVHHGRATRLPDQLSPFNL